MCFEGRLLHASRSEKNLSGNQSTKLRRQLGKRHFALLAAIEIAQASPHLGPNSSSPNNHGGARVDLVGPPQAARKIARISEIDVKPRLRRSSASLSAAVSPTSPIGTSAIGRGGGGGSVDQHRQALDAGRPADAGHRRSAHHLDQPVIATAAHHGALRAEVRRDELERRMGIVIKAAHETRVQPIIDVKPIEPGTHPIKKSSRFRIQVISEVRSTLGDALIGLLLRIEDAQRIAFRAAAGCPPTIRTCVSKSSRPAPRDRRRGFRGRPEY